MTFIAAGGRTTRDTATEFCKGQTVFHTKVSGWTTRKTELVGLKMEHIVILPRASGDKIGK